MIQATTATRTFRAPALVLYDGQCPLCQRSVRILKRLDWLRRLEYIDARNEVNIPVTDPPLRLARLIEEMHVVTPDHKRVYHGFGAFRWMAWRLPLLWPIAPLLYLPGVPAIGQRIYLWVARNRFQLVPCSENECQLPVTAGLDASLDGQSLQGQTVPRWRER